MQKIKIYFYLVVGFVLSIYAVEALAAERPPADTANACSIFKEKRHWYRATRKAEKRWGVPISVQLAIIHQESSFQAKVRPKRKKRLLILPGARLSSAKGYSQAIDETWKHYQRDTKRTRAERDNFRDATDFVGWYLDKSTKRLGLSKDDARNQYLAYHEGQSAYAKGSFEKKPWLVKTANRVEQRAATYAVQLSSCQKKLRRGIPFAPII